MSIQIIRIVAELPARAGSPGRPSKWAGVADLLPADGSWAEISGAKTSEYKKARAHGIEVCARQKSTYARRLAA